MTELRERLEEGLKLHQAGRIDDAETVYRDVLAADPENADALHFLGLIAHQKGDAAQAVELISAALDVEPDRPTFHFNLGAALVALNDSQEAIGAYEKAVEFKSDWAEAHVSLATLQAQAGDDDQALSGFQRAVDLKPDYGEAHNGMALALKALDRLEEAERACRRAVDIKPGLVEAWTNLGNILQDSGRLSEAVEAQRQAISIDPDYATAHYNLAKALADQWRIADAVVSYQTAIEKDPHYLDAWESLMLNELYLPEVTEESIFQRHRAWAASLDPVTELGGDDFDQSPDRRLRIGYLSPDFRTHSCAYFLAPLFAAHDRSRVEVFAYSNLRRPDEMTDQFRDKADQWRDITDLDDQEAARLIREDRIDVLVELAGHSANNRLSVCAYRSAPVQVSWLGYPATTGLASIDYRFTDDVTDPPGPADDLHSEALWRLEGGFHCYRASETAPDVGLPPVEKSGVVTFGSFNNIAKITPGVIDVWTRILTDVDGSRLILKGKMFDNNETRQLITAEFTSRGIDEDRLDLRSWIGRDATPLALYHEIDIALDTFPYNGATTTFEALWMGVPVVTLRGKRHAGRVGAGILTHLGYPGWIAESTGAYTDIAVSLADNKENLIEIRAALRSRLISSSLGNEPEFARKIETAYREMWRLRLVRQ